jgi:hypothetical protein
MRRIFLLALTLAALAGCGGPAPTASALRSGDCTPLYRAPGAEVTSCGPGGVAPTLPDDATRAGAGALDKVYKEDRPH